MAYEIKHKNGQTLMTVNSLTYSDKRMGEEFVSCTIYAANPIDFEIGDYIMYRGSEYYLNTLPTMKRKSSNGSVGDAICYDGVKFSGSRTELTDCTFLDVVNGDNGIHTALPDFSFYAASVRELGDRLEKNLSRLGKGWKVTYGDISGAKTNITVAARNVNCWDALALAKSEFGVNFSVSGRTITIGDVENALNTEALRYGKGKGCVTIERTADDSQQIITRLRAYGNTTNMPTRFYANRDVVCRMPIVGKSVMQIKKEWFVGDGLPEEITQSGEFNSNPRYWMSLFNAVGKQLSEYDGCVIGSTAMYEFPPSCFNNYDEDTKTSLATDINGKKYIIAAYYQYNFVHNYIFAINATKEEAEAISEIKFEISVNKDAWPADYKSDAKMPNNLHIDRVMLPSFPEVQYPCLEKNVDALGVREATVYFDGSDDREDIYPTIEGIDVSISKGSGLTDNGVFGTDTTTETVPPFEIEITFADSVADNMVFDPWNYRVSGDKPKISMKDGMCAGREFEVIKCKQKEGSSRTYVLTCNRVEDTGLRLYYPYSQYNISAGDKFVLLGISMPPAYVDAAAARLEKAAKAYLDANCEMKYKYQLQMSSIYVHSGKNWHDTICAGQIVTFHDDDVVGKSDVSYPIDSIEIKEGENALPSYNIVLSDEPAVSTITRILNSVNDVEQRAITEIHPLFIRREGALVGIYNPAEKALTLELGAGEGASESEEKDPVVTDQYFETYKVGTKTAYKVNEDTGEFELDENGDKIPAGEVDVEAVRLKPQYEGLFAEGWISALGINPRTIGGGGMCNIDIIDDDTYEDWMDGAAFDDDDVIEGGWGGSSTLAKLTDVMLDGLAEGDILVCTKSGNGEYIWVNRKMDSIDKSWLANELSKYATIDELGKYVTIATDQTITGKKTFTNAIVLKNGDDEVELSIDAEHHALKINGAAYSTSWMSALGLNPDAVSTISVSGEAAAGQNAIVGYDWNPTTKVLRFNFGTITGGGDGVSASWGTTNNNVASLTIGTTTKNVLLDGALAGYIKSVSWSDITGTVPTWNQDTTGTADNAKNAERADLADALNADLLLGNLWGNDFYPGNTIDGDIALGDGSEIIFGTSGEHISLLGLDDDGEEYAFALSTSLKIGGGALIEYDAENDAYRLHGNLYADGWMSAMGMNPDAMPAGVSEDRVSELIEEAISGIGAIDVITDQNASEGNAITGYEWDAAAKQLKFKFGTISGGSSETPSGSNVRWGSYYRNDAGVAVSRYLYVGDDWELVALQSGIEQNSGGGANWSDVPTDFKAPYAGRADKADKLTSAVSLWGNSFDGSSSINGSITLGSGSVINFGDSSHSISLLDDSKGTRFKLSHGLQIGDGIINWDAANKALKFSSAIYSESWISALGANSATIDEVVINNNLSVGGLTTTKELTVGLDDVAGVISLRSNVMNAPNCSIEVFNTTSLKLKSVANITLDASEVSVKSALTVGTSIKVGSKTLTASKWEKFVEWAEININ